MYIFVIDEVHTWRFHYTKKYFPDNKNVSYDTHY